MVAVLRGAYVGYRAGLFPELLRIAAYLVTAVVTLRFHEPLAQFLTLNTFLNAATANAAAFAALLVAVFALSKLVTMLILKILKVGEGGALNRLLGMTVGGCRWIVILSLAFMLIAMSPLTSLKADIETRSVSGPAISQVAPMIFDFLKSLSPQMAVDGPKGSKT